MKVNGAKLYETGVSGFANRRLTTWLRGRDGLLGWKIPVWRRFGFSSSPEDGEVQRAAQTERGEYLRVAFAQAKTCPRTAPGWVFGLRSQYLQPASRPSRSRLTRWIPCWLLCPVFSRGAESLCRCSPVRHLERAWSGSPCAKSRSLATRRCKPSLDLAWTYRP